MPKIAVIARIVSKPESTDLVKGVLEGLVDATESEAGTEQYVLNQDTADANTFWFYEFYVDHDALGTHGGSTALAEAFTTLADHVAEAPQLHVLTPLRAKGLAI